MVGSAVFVGGRGVAEDVDVTTKGVGLMEGVGTDFLQEARSAAVRNRRMRMLPGIFTYHLPWMDL